MSPVSPKGRCRVCSRLNCTEHKKQPRQRTPASVQRPDYNSWPERKRRAAVVADWLAAHGIETEDGQVMARCPDCRQWRTRWVADHVRPLARGGEEAGELRCHCAVCSGRQGARLAARRRHRG